MSRIIDKTSRIEADVEKEKTPRISDIVRLWKYVFSSAKGVCILYMSLTIFLSLLRPLLAYIWGNYVDRANSYIAGTNLFPILSLAIGYYIISFLSDLIQRYTERNEEIEKLDIVQKNRFQEMLESKMYSKVSSLSTEHTDVPKINDIMNRVFEFTSSGWEGLSQGIMKPGYFVIAKAVSVISIAASLYVIEPWLCLILIIAPIPTLYITYVSNKMQFKFVKENTKLKREIQYFQDLMLGPAVKEIKALSLFDFFYKKWKDRVDEYTIKENKVYLKRMAIGILSNIIVGGASAFANLFAIILLTMGRISVGALGAVMSLIGTLISDTSALFSSIATLLSKKNEASMFFDLMDLPDQVQSGAELDSIKSIQSENLFYRYPLTEKYVLNGINLSIRIGERIALVGENGAGKTTFVKMLCGLIKPSKGELKINGIPTEEINPYSHYNIISAVTQEPARYITFTVSDNVFLGDPTRFRDEEKLNEAIAFSGMESVPPDTMLGKDVGGTDLSGGQWQKIAISRSAYRNRDFILLDEPTGNLDPIFETEIFKKYLALAQGRTVIMVTHRISVASLADRIVVFKDGVVFEDGTHQELIARNGEYVRLYFAQAKWYDR